MFNTNRNIVAARKEHAEVFKDCQIFCGRLSTVTSNIKTIFRNLITSRKTCQHQTLNFHTCQNYPTSPDTVNLLWYCIAGHGME